MIEPMDLPLDLDEFGPPIVATTYGYVCTGRDGRGPVHVVQDVDAAWEDIKAARRAFAGLRLWVVTCADFSARVIPYVTSLLPPGTRDADHPVPPNRAAAVEAGPFGIREVAKRFGPSRSTILRLLALHPAPIVLGAGKRKHYRWGDEASYREWLAVAQSRRTPVAQPPAVRKPKRDKKARIRGGVVDWAAARDSLLGGTGERR